MITDARARGTGPGGHLGAATGSSAAGLHPSTGTSEKSLPGPAAHDLTPGKPAHSPGRPSAVRQRRIAAVLKRSLLDDGKDRGTLSRPGMTPS